MEERAHEIVLVESAERQVEATGADVLVRVSGISGFTPREPQLRAKIMARIIEALAELGIEKTQVSITSLSFSVEKGLALRSSTAEIELTVRCRTTDEVSTVLGVLSTTKSIMVRGTNWRYDGEVAARAELSRTCLEAAMMRAEGLATAAGKRATVKRIEDYVALNQHAQAPHGGPRLSASKNRLTGDEAVGGGVFDGFAMTNFKTLRGALQVTFTLEGP